MVRIVFLVYGIVAYVVFFVTFLYLFGFMGNVFVPKSIDSGPAGPAGWALIANAALVGLFVVQHTIMARSSFKSWWTRILPKPIERSTFVLATSVVLIVLFWSWRPMPALVWEIQAPTLRAMVWLLYGTGLCVVLYSSFLIDHFDLFGLRQVFLYLQQREYEHRPFMVHSLYNYVRHPLMLGFLIALWATPTMSVGHLFFSLLLTAYIFFGTKMEERELVQALGPQYEQYREETPGFFPLPKRQKGRGPVQTV